VASYSTGGLHVIKNKKNTRPQVLALNKETVVHLTHERLKRAVGGESDNSTHPSQCVTWCAGAP